MLMLMLKVTFLQYRWKIVHYLTKSFALVVSSYFPAEITPQCNRLPNFLTFNYPLKRHLATYCFCEWVAKCGTVYWSNQKKQLSGLLMWIGLIWPQLGKSLSGSPDSVSFSIIKSYIATLEIALHRLRTLYKPWTGVTDSSLPEIYN